MTAGSRVLSHLKLDAGTSYSWNPIGVVSTLSWWSGGLPENLTSTLSCSGWTANVLMLVIISWVGASWSPENLKGNNECLRLNLSVLCQRAIGFRSVEMTCELSFSIVSFRPSSVSSLSENFKVEEHCYPADAVGQVDSTRNSLLNWPVPTSVLSCLEERE